MSGEINRRSLLKGGALCAAGTLIPSAWLWRGEVTAQYGYPYPYVPADYYQIMQAQQMNWIQQQNAIAAQQQYLQQAAAYQEWVRQRQAAFVQMSREFRSDEYIVSEPSVWEYVKSVYAFAKDSGMDRVLMYGLARYGGPVVVRWVIPALAAFWTFLEEHMKTEQKKQSSTAPQTSEKKMGLKLPDGQVLEGVGFQTVEGAIGISSQEVATTSGQQGRLAKMRNSEGETLVIV